MSNERKELRIFVRDIRLDEGLKPKNPSNFDIYQKKSEKGYEIFVAFNGKWTKIGINDLPITLIHSDTEDDWNGSY